MVIDPISIAIQVALVVASIILTAKNVEVGKLDDINVDTGSYNRLVPRVYGTQVIVPQTIWIANNKLIEVKKKKKILLGLGGSITTYHYFATFAVALTNNRVQLRRVWANDELIYDATDTSSGGFSDDLLQEVKDNAKGGQFDWDFKDGRDSQSISKLINRVDGISETPAYNGISFLAVQYLPLKNSGNSIPQFKCEVVEVSDVVHEALAIPAPLGVSAPTILDEYDRVIQIGTSNSIAIIDAITRITEMALLADVGSDIFFSPGTAYDRNQNAIIHNKSGGNSAHLVSVTNGSVLGFAQGAMSTLESSVAQNGQYWMSDISNRVGVFTVALMGLGAPVETFAIPDADANFPEVAPTSGLPRFGVSYTGQFGGTFLYIHDLPVIDLNALIGYGTRPGIGYSQKEQAFILVGGAGISKISLTGQLLMTLPRACPANVFGLRHVSTFDPLHVWLVSNDNHLIKLDIESFEIDREIDIDDISGLSSGSDVLPLETANALLVKNGAWYTVYLDRVAQQNTSVQHIIEDLADQIGFPPSRLDASAGTRTVGGMIVAGEDARRSIDELLKITGYDLIEEDGMVKVLDRGNAPVMAIDANDLGTDDNDGKPYRLERTLTREADAPWKVELGFADLDGDFESNLAIARRAIDAVATQTVLSVDTPIALDVDSAKTFAGKMLSQAHRERAGVNLSLPMVKYGRLSPGDVITVPDGIDALNVKIVRASGAHVLSLTGVIDDPTGIDTLLSGASRDIPSPSLSRIGVPSVILVDSALPYDDIPSPSGYGLSSFSVQSGRDIGIVDIVRSSDDGVSFALLDVTEGAPVIAVASAALADIAHPTIMDHASAFTINLPRAPIAATQQELRDDNTRNLIFVAAGDDWEVVQFMNVSDLGGGDYSLSGFYRGLRGTEHLIGAHSTGDRVVFISDGYIRAGDETHFEVSSKYAALRTEDDDPPVVDYTPSLRGLRPYSPINLLIEKPNEDALISWTRRTRIGGADLNGSDVPVSEITEMYEIEIIDSMDAVVAAKTGITSNSYTYTAVEQLTDLGAADSPFTARVTQVSAVVGRGIPTELQFANTPFDPLIFQLYFPDATTAADNSQHSHNVNLMGGATVSTAQTWAGQAASVDCREFNKFIELADSQEFSRGSGVWTYEAMLYITEDSANNLDLFAHWLNTSDRSFAIQRLSNKRWESYHSSNSSAFNTITTSNSHLFPLNQWAHFAITRHLSGNVSFWMDGSLIKYGDPGVSSYHNSFNDNPRPFRIVGNEPADNGIKSYVGWAAMRKDDVYGEVAVISPPMGPYSVIPPQKVKAIAFGMSGSGHGGATWSAARYKTSDGTPWILPTGATLSADPDTVTYNGAISSSGFFLDQSYVNAGFTADAFIDGKIAKQIMTLASPIDEPYEVSFIPYIVMQMAFLIRASLSNLYMRMTV